MAMFLYFAYGSNMLTARLQALNRCPTAIPVGVALAPALRFVYGKRSRDGSGKATLTPISRACLPAHGVLFEISDVERAALDRAEGNGYETRHDISLVRLRDGETVQAVTYVSSAEMFDDSLRPYDWYRALVLAGAWEHRLPKVYIRHLCDLSATRDPLPERKERQAALSLLGSKARTLIRNVE